MTNKNNYTPETGEDMSRYIKRLEAEGLREITIRKALRAHFNLSVAEVIAACATLSVARELELKDLRRRFPTLNENRLTWKISQTLTIPKEDARVWAQTILAEEGEALP